MKACSNFKRTHLFLIEAWEGIYRAMIDSYLTHSTSATGKNLQDAIHHSMNDIENSESFVKTFNDTLDKLKSGQRDFLYEFKTFIQSRASMDDTWRFWVQFVFQDAMAYICLFLAIGSGDWNLRLASIKQMAPIFQHLITLRIKN